MSDRDDEGRPVPTRNAGAFLAPTGMIPVPSSILDTAQQTTADRRSLRLAGLTAIALWTLLSGALRYALAATESAADVRPTVIGDEMTRLLHTDAAWYALNAVFLAVAVALTARWAHQRATADLLGLASMGIVGAVLVGALMSLLGGIALAAAVVVAVVWLLVAYRRWR